MCRLKAIVSVFVTLIVFSVPFVNAEMVLIPEGEYEMGDHHDGMTFSLPVHTVYIDAFYMDTCEVTAQQYADALNWAWSQGGLIWIDDGNVLKHGSSQTYCTTAAGTSIYTRITWDGSTFGAVAGCEDHPMIEVSWWGAAAYANWRSGMEGHSSCYDTSTWGCDFEANGYRLPTEAEWEKAARGGEYNPYFRYPWGDSLISNIANYAGSGDPWDSAFPIPETTPMGFYTGEWHLKGDFGWPGSQEEYQTSDGENGYGLFDMEGNVGEWVNDWYGDNYYSLSPYDNPRGPASGGWRMVRGGTWSSNVQLETAWRWTTTVNALNNNEGFRLAKAIDENDTFACGYTITPLAGTVPFSITHRFTLTNLQSGTLHWTRRIAGKVHVISGNGNSYSNWRGGYTNVNPGVSYTTAFSVTIPAALPAIGNNTFTMVTMDVTDAPYNQPPYPPSGTTCTKVNVVTANAP